MLWFYKTSINITAKCRPHASAPPVAFVRIQLIWEPHNNIQASKKWRCGTMYNQIIITAPGSQCTHICCFSPSFLTTNKIWPAPILVWWPVAYFLFKHLCSWIRIREVEPQKLYALREKVGRWHLYLLLLLLNSNQCEVYASTHPGWLLSSGKNLAKI